jgi:hypothetical protein
VGQRRAAAFIMLHRATPSIGRQVPIAHIVFIAHIAHIMFIWHIVRTSRKSPNSGGIPAAPAGIASVPAGR